MADKAVEKPAGRPMRYPYTFSAKIAQFPIKHYIKNQWIWRYYFIAAVACVPVFYKISKLGLLRKFYYLFIVLSIFICHLSSQLSRKQEGMGRVPG